MPTAIYQKYRPQTFNEVVGHEYIKKILLNALKNDRLGHAYLFAGPRGTGKTSIARLISKAVNCKHPKNGDACGKCEVCKSIESLSFMDLIEIDAASNRGIDEIRNLKEKVNFAPAEAKKKVYIIDEVHMLTKEAFNALLKTLEEPPEFVMFILATTEPHKIPATILSRVQRFDLKLGTKEEVINKLTQIAKSEGVEIEEDACAKIYELGGGSFRDSESIMEKLLSVEVKKDRKITLQEVENTIGLIDSKLVSRFVDLLVQGDTESLLAEMDRIISEGLAVDQLVDQSIEEIRRRIRSFYANKLGKSGEDLRRLIKIAAELSEANYKLKDAKIQTLPIEIAIFNLAKPQEKALEGTVKPSVVKHVIEPEVKKEKEERVSSKEETESPKEVKKEDEQESVPDKVNTIVKFEDVKKAWPEIISKSKGQNHHLFAFLSSALLKKLDGDTLVLEVGYKFHKQKIESVTGRKIICGILKDQLKTKLNVSCVVNPELIKSTDEDVVDKDLSNEDIVEEIFQEE
ncbi:MAG: polymerase III, subunit gamma and tau protein [candidate division WS6 bacterium GW2011_GWA2_37_6]|uniref:DNA polymerase III subunit gamma/tau n=1 Tax=candidate division WS6 bacterium GW2011_GWA2_37_6 TaxID=1619087 RepID=A0A0G0K3B1_9BACT|nr:MAG: polymerase III, subunit gamma and tau protein [candidate division WS6 bacterium GW2011_GWA2_37_6]